MVFCCSGLNGPRQLAPHGILGCVWMADGVGHRERMGWKDRGREEEEKRENKGQIESCLVLTAAIQELESHTPVASPSSFTPHPLAIPPGSKTHAKYLLVLQQDQMSYFLPVWTRGLSSSFLSRALSGNALGINSHGW